MTNSKDWIIINIEIVASVGAWIEMIRYIEQYVVSISVEMRIERKVSSKHEIGKMPE